MSAKAEARTAAPEHARARAPAPAAEIAGQAQIELGIGIGNLALQELMGLGLRAKLEIGGVDDPEEHEADALAGSMLSGRAAPCTCGATCSKCAGGGSAILRRKAEAGVTQNIAGPSIAFGGSGRNMDFASRRRFGAQLGPVDRKIRIHDDPYSAGVARAIGARAFAVGHHIGFARGEYSPGTGRGQALLAHELAHVALGHGGVRRVGMDDGLSDAELDYQIEQGRQMAEAQRRAREHHEAWSKAVDTNWQRELPDQAKDITEERTRLNLALTGLQARAFDAAAEPNSWLNGQLAAAGYSGPSIVEVKRLWGQALVAADALKMGAEATPKDDPSSDRGVISPEVKLEAMTLVPAYYAAAKTFAAAVETSLRTWADGVNLAAEEKYQADLADYDRSKRAQDETCKMSRGDLGGGAFCGGMALARGAPPSSPTPVTIPPAISTTIDGPAERAQSAQTKAEWSKVSADLQANAIALGKLVTASLPTMSPIQIQAKAVEALDARLEKLATENAVFRRIPAVFYPKDAGEMIRDKEGQEVFIPESVPWQFYLTHHAKIDESNGYCVDAGEWVLIDITNPKAAETKAPGTNVDSEKLAKGEWVDPPIGLFTPLNSKLRFPEGELYFTLPSGTHYVHHMTEPWSLSDYLSAAAMALAAAAIVATVIATGGATAPAAIALGASIGSAVLGTAATLADLSEKREHGLLTEGDVNRAMLDIGLNIISVASMGLGRVVTAPGAAARFGALASTLRVLRYANLAGDLVQVSLVTTDLVGAFTAINDNPQLTDDQKNKMIASLARRALLTGAMMTIAIKGDVSDIRSSGTLHITGVDADGTPLAGKASGEDLGPAKPHLDADAPTVHTKVSPEVHAAEQAKGTGLDLVGQRHAIGVAGAGPLRDIYFCSDLCTSAVNRIGAVLEVLPQNHPMRPALEDMLKKATIARNGLKTGKIEQAEADKIAGDLRDRMSRLAQDSDHGRTLQTLFDMNPQILSSTADDVRKSIDKGLDIQSVRSEAELAFAEQMPLAEFMLKVAGKKPRGPPSFKEADDAVMDAQTRALLPDFDRRVSKTGLISSIKARLNADKSLGVTIKGEIDSGKLSRNPERIAAGAAKAPSFNSMLRSRLGGLKEIGLEGWQRLHLWGPGFGDEAAAGMMLGPASMNQLWQNGELVIVSGKKVHYGIEGYIRELSDVAKASGGKVRLTAAANAWGDPTPGGFKSPAGEPVLRSVEYRIELVDPDGNVVRQTTVNMDLPDPASWKNPAAVKPVVTVSGGGTP